MSFFARRWLGIITVLSLAASLALPAAAAGAQGEGETGFGNNLSFPVIWSDGVTKPLRGTELVPALNEPPCATIDGVDWYCQQQEFNTWQAENDDGSAAPVTVSSVDWGDNLEARAWAAGSRVRVETRLFEDLSTPMTAYTMRSLSGSGATEMQGTNGVTYSSLRASIFSGAARLTIQQITPGADLTWDPTATKWTGAGVIPNPASPDGTYYNMAAYQTGEGPGYYVGEVNVAGQILYGYNWSTPATPGLYRLTFSLDGQGFSDATGRPLNTFITDATQIAPSGEEDGSGGVPEIDAANNLSYIDVTLTDRRGRMGRVHGPGTVAQGDTATITVEVINTGAQSETYTVSIDEATGGYADSQSVTVPAGETVTLTFDWPTSPSTIPGDYTFTVTVTVPDESGSEDVIGQTTIHIHVSSLTACPNPTPVIQGMTAAVINPTAPVTGAVDATGCDIGVYFAPGKSGVVRNAEIFGAASFGIYSNGARVNVMHSRIHDIARADDECGGEGSMEGDTAGMDDDCDGDEGSGQRRYIGGKTGTGILFLGIDRTATGVISGNTISQYGRRGISVSGPLANAQITANTLLGGRPDGLGHGGPFQTGIWIANGASANITDNTVANHTSMSATESPWVGIMVAGGAGHNDMPNYTTRLQINANRLVNNDAGVLLSNVPVDPGVSTKNHLAANVIQGPSAGLEGEGEPGGTPRLAGIKVMGGVGDRITGNTISGYVTPVYVAPACVSVSVH